LSEQNNDFERLIETSKFPVELVSEKSAREKAGGGRPPYWEMVFWWTRKPLIGARAIIAGALVPSTVNVNEFIRFLRLNEKSPHRHNPVIPEKWLKWFKGKSLLDPFAGFGSIPLEALRLGLSKVVAVELLPTAYVFLKAILEYPLKYGKQLVKDVEKWGNWVTEQLRKDPIIQKLYDPDVAVYIGSWEIKCPHCGKWTPLIGNWWLARVYKERRSEGGRKRKVYVRLAWMKPEIKEDMVDIKIVDLNRELGNEAIKEAKIVKKGRFSMVIVKGKQYFISAPNINANGEKAQCLHCGNAIRYIDPVTGKHYLETKNARKEVRERLEWYVKYAMKTLSNNVSKLARLRLLIKVNERLEFEVCDVNDQGKLAFAKKHVRKLIENRDPDVPEETIAPYSTRFIHPLNYYAKTWQDLFNSRQLLTLTKLTKLIREAGNLIEEDKIKKGLSQEASRKYAQAITTYLSMALIKYADYNSITTGWHSSFLIVRNTIAFRGIAMQWNCCDINPFAETTGSWVRSLSTVINGVKYLVCCTYTGKCQNIADYGNLTHDLPLIQQSSLTRTHSSVVLLNDASVLKINKKFSVIVTDPPYYSDVPYSELSDFYYVWLKRTLSDLQRNRLIPRYVPESFFKRVGAKTVEIQTQWKEYGEREVSVKLASKEIMKRGRKRFLELLRMSFINCSLHLRNEGLLITYYAHTSPDAWIALLEAGWRGGKFYVVNAFPIATESLQRAIARGKYALDTSIVVIWRMGCSGAIGIENLYEKAIRRATSAALNLIRSGRTGSDLFVGTMASILSTFTRYEKLYGPTGLLNVKNLVTEYVYPATAKALAMALGKFAGSPGEVKRPESLFYLIIKALFPKMGKAKRKLDRTNVALISIGTKADINDLQKFRILYREKENFYLEELATEDRKSFEEILRRKGISPTKPVIESAIDALHLLEYYSVTLPLNLFLTKFSQLKEEYSSEVEEAINIAAILAKVLPSTDPEKKACEEIIARIKGEKLA